MTINKKLAASEEENNVLSNDSDSNVSASENSHDSEVEDNDLTNTGWADAISKILKQKPKSKSKSIVLSKAKKINAVKKVEKKTSGFEIEGSDGTVVKKEDISEDVKTEHLEPIKKKRRELPKLRIKPNILEKDRERLLQKIATKGVVQLFNAVRMQQKDITKKLEEAGPLEVRKEKVLKNIDKRAFLDVLMGEKSQRVEMDTETKQTKKKRKTVNNADKDITWSVLKEDFMMGAKMKDWDKELESENVETEPS